MTVDEKRLFDDLHDKRENQDKAFSDFTARNLRRSQSEKYSEEAHFIYELLQNADDAGATYTKFKVCEDKLLFLHNGKPFTISEDKEDANPYGDINAITAPAYSSKQSDTQKIGKFGVGFKAVYIYSDEPEIYSGHFNFKIVHQMVPVEVEKCLYEKKKEETLFVLPFKNLNCGAVIAKKLSEIESPLLFLNHLKSIDWQKDEEFHHYTKHEQPIAVYGSISVSRVDETNDNDKNEYYMFSKQVDLEEYGKHNILVGYLLDKDGYLITWQKRKVFCFFPTKTSYGMVAVMQAPFLLTDSREQVLQYEPVNKKLRRELANLMGDSLPILVKMSNEEVHLINDNLSGIVPYDYNETQSWARGYSNRGVTNGDDIKDFYESLKQHLCNDNLFLTRSGRYVSRNKIMLASSSLKKLVNREQLNLLMKTQDGELDFLDYETFMSFRTYLVKEIGIKEFDNESLIKRIDSNFMSLQSKEWVENLYENFKGMKRAKYCSFIKTNKGDYTSLYDKEDQPRLFAPVSTSENATNISQFLFIDAETYKNHKKFFDEQGVKEPDRLDYLNILLKKYENCSGLCDDEILSDFNLIREMLSDRNESENIEQMLDCVKTKYKVKSVSNGTCTMDFPFNTYFKTMKIEEYKKETQHDIKFFDIEFYINGGASKDEIKEFAKEVGVNDTILIDNVHYSDLTLPGEDGFHIVRKDEYEMSPYLVIQRNRVYTNYPKFRGMEDYDMLNFDKIGFDADFSKFIWKSILNYHVNNVSTSKGYCSKYYGKKTYYYEFESSLLKKLKEIKWIIKGDGTKVCPTNILKDEFHRIGYDRNDEWENALELGKDAQIEAEQQKTKEKDEIDNLFDDLITAKKAKALYDKFHDFSKDDISEFRNWVTNRRRYVEDNIDYTNTKNYDNGWGYSTNPNYVELFTSKTNVRKTEHYIGVKLYEGLLEKEKVKYQVPNNENSNEYGYDIKVLPNKLVRISVVKDKEIDDDTKYVPIGITKDQHKYMTESNTNRFTIIRIALKDLEIEFDRDIRDVYGAETDIDKDDHLRAKCDKLVRNFWSSKTAEDFHKMISEYYIQIHREL